MFRGDKQDVDGCAVINIKNLPSAVWVAHLVSTSSHFHLCCVYRSRFSCREGLNTNMLWGSLLKCDVTASKQSCA